MIAVYVACGGAIGAVIRFLVMSWMGRMVAGSTFPYGTLTVNIVGSLLIGCVIGLFAKTLPHSMEMRAFLVVGVLGGFTTFSSFSLDVVSMVERGDIAAAAIYIILSVFGGVAALFASLYVMRLL